MFQEAVKHEHAYPVKFGPIVLYARDFKDKLPMGLAERYRRRGEEYTVKVSKRAYCKNLIEEALAPEPGTVNKGKKLALTKAQAKEREEANVKVVQCGAILAPHLMIGRLGCYRCKGNACPDCGDPTEWVHDNCVPTYRERQEKGIPKALTKTGKPGEKGLVRGKDFQLCPKCGTPCELRDGCNFMQCVLRKCQEGFCFICGAGGLKDVHEHWKLGMPCPKFGQPGERNALFDQVIDGEFAAGVDPNLVIADPRFEPGPNGHQWVVVGEGERPNDECVVM